MNILNNLHLPKYGIINLRRLLLRSISEKTERMW